MPASIKLIVTSFLILFVCWIIAMSMGGEFSKWLGRLIGSVAIISLATMIISILFVIWS